MDGAASSSGMKREAGPAEASAKRYRQAVPVVVSTHAACATENIGIHGIAVDADGTIFMGTEHKTVIGVMRGGRRMTISGQHDESGFLNGFDARFSAMQGIALDKSGALIVADTMNHSIRHVAKNGFVTTLVGSTGTPGKYDGGKSVARFNFPYDVLVGKATNEIFVLDHGNDAIRVIDLQGFVPHVRTLAGGVQTGFLDGTGGGAQFDGPTSMAMDVDGSLVVVDSHNDALRRVTMDGKVTTIAGKRRSGARVRPAIPAECLCSDATFKMPHGVVVDGEGAIIVSDCGHRCLRKINNGVVTRIAGGSDGKSYRKEDGTGSRARFNMITKMAWDERGRLLVLDTNPEQGTTIRIVEGGFCRKPYMAIEDIPHDTETSRKLCALQRFATMLHDHDRVDVVFLVEGERFHAHKVVLSSQSEYFANLLSESMLDGREEVVRISQVTAAAFRVVLSYIYTSEVSLWEADDTLHIDITLAADMMQLQQLSDHCMDVFAKRLTCDNVVHRLIWAYSDGPLEAREIAKTFFIDNAGIVKVSATNCPCPDMHARALTRGGLSVCANRPRIPRQ